MMQNIKNAAIRTVFGHHIVVVLIIKGNTHVEYNIWVPHLIDYLDFFNEVNYALFGDAFSTESFDCDWGSHPLSFENFAISSTSDVVVFIVKLELRKLYVEVKAMLLESLDKVLISILI